MCLTEPGYYEDGSFGVRIENVELVKRANTKYKFDGVEYLTMEPVTLVSRHTHYHSIASLLLYVGAYPEEDDRCVSGDSRGGVCVYVCVCVMLFPISL